jgi:hypothetical protein
MHAIDSSVSQGGGGFPHLPRWRRVRLIWPPCRRSRTTRGRSCRGAEPRVRVGGLAVRRLSNRFFASPSRQARAPTCLPSCITCAFACFRCSCMSIGVREGSFTVQRVKRRPHRQTSQRRSWFRCLKRPLVACTPQKISSGHWLGALKLSERGGGLLALEPQATGRVAPPQRQIC